jgi:cell cycle arrest protein BUB2
LCAFRTHAGDQSPYRIYLWLTLLDIPPFPTDDYLALIHRGRSPAYAKIRNDTFRTLATDPLFKRRVTEASLIRLLNAISWKFHDASQNSPRLPSSQGPTSQEVRSELDHASPTKAVTSPLNFPASATENSTTGVDPASYVQGMNVLCAPFLYAARSEVEAFALFHHFVTRECPGYVRGAMEGVHKGLALVDQCLAIVEPKLANYLLSKGMHAELYAFPSVLTFCACTPPLPEVLHLWDFLFAYGPHLNILCIVAQLIRMRDTILGSPR